jgi:hypothetical protein
VTQDKLLKKMFDFQKANMQNAFKAMTLMQGQGEKILDTLVNQTPWIPDDGKKAISDWNMACKKGNANFKDFVETNFNKVEELFFESKAKAGGRTKKAA